MSGTTPEQPSQEMLKQTNTTETTTKEPSQETLQSRTSVESTDNSSKTVDTELSNLKTSTESSALKGNIEDQSTMLSQIDDLLSKYKSLADGIKGAEGNRDTKKELRHRLEENIQDLERMQKDLNKHSYTNLTTFKARIGELISFYEHYEQVRQIVVLGGSTSDIHAIIDSTEDAKRARKYEKADAKNQKKMNEILHNTALTSLRNNDMERYEEYLEAVVNGQVEPSSHPFYKAHSQSFRMIEATNPSLYQILAPSGNGRIQYGMPVTGTIEGIPVTTTINTPSNKPESAISRLGKGFGDVIGSLVPSIENNPRQKKAWEQFGTIAALGGSIFMGWKIIQNLFSKKADNPGKRGKVAGWTAGLVAFMNGDKIIKGGKNWVQDAFNLHPAEKIQASTELFQSYGFTDTQALQIAEMHVGAPVATISALHFIPIYELSAQHIVDYKNNEFQFNYDNYKKYIDTYNWTAEQKRTVLAAGENLKKNGSINEGLNLLGITSQDDLDKIAGGDKRKTIVDSKTVQERYLECTENVTSGVNVELYKRGLKAKDVESAKKVIKEYEENQGKNIDTLITKRNEEGLLEVATNHPMVRQLSDLGIDFKDSEEITKTEERLKSIQNGMKNFAPGTDGYKPYSIEGKKLIFLTSDTQGAKKICIPDDVQDKFSNQSWTLDDYPTILNNKDKFLEFMNDKNNQMWGKEIKENQPES